MAALHELPQALHLPQLVSFHTGLQPKYVSVSWIKDSKMEYRSSNHLLVWNKRYHMATSFKPTCLLEHKNVKITTQWPWHLSTSKSILNLSSAFVRLFYVLSWPCAFWRWTDDNSSLGEAGYLLRVFLSIEEARQRQELTVAGWSDLSLQKQGADDRGFFPCTLCPHPPVHSQELTRAVLTQVRGTRYCFPLYFCYFWNGCITVLSGCFTNHSFSVWFAPFSG